jgi:DtxR family Mn-dependent transcriptional regulator
MLRHHRLIELFLSELLGVPWDQVHEEADRLEHVLSEDLEERIAAKLGQPAYDPHGDPIPTVEGVIPCRSLRRLTELSPGDLGEVAQITLQKPPVLQYLAGLGLRPGAAVTVAGVAPFGDVVTVRVRAGDGERGPHALGESLARHVLLVQSDCPVADLTEAGEE